MRCILGLLIVFSLIDFSSAHDSWLSRNGYRNNAGEWCCGESDCGVFVYGHIGESRFGYEVDATFRIGEGQGVVDITVKELVPYTEAIPSPDGRFWRCKRPDGSRRCFFHPLPTM